MPICCVIRPPHRLGGVAKSRSLFVATPPLILALLDEVSKIFETGNNGFFQKKVVRFLSNRASHCGVKVGRFMNFPCFSGFRQAQLAVDIFAQP